MRKLSSFVLFGFLLFSFRHLVVPAAHGVEKAGKFVYRVVV
jgi:hypothetical protein